MTRFPSAALLVLALALPLPPAAARAQSETLLDNAQRATIEDYFKTQAEKNAAADQARKAKQATPTDKAKTPAKGKKAEKPKKPAKPKAAEKDKTKDKAKSKAKAKDKNKAKDKDKNKAKTKTNGKASAKTNDKAKPAAATAQLERGQVLAPDLPRRALPKDLDSQLGKLPRGTQRVIVGDDVVLFERKTGKILDVMADAVKVGAVGR